MGDWNEVIEIGSVTNFEERWKELERKYGNHPNVIKYLKNTWEPLKEHFVTTWTSKCLHLETINTSGVKESHAALKRWLKVSTLDLQ